MARTKYIYLDTPPPALAPPHAPAQQVVASPPPLAPGDLGWPQQTPPQGMALPVAAAHGTTQIVYVPMQTGALVPQHPTYSGPPASSLTGCLLTAIGVLVVGVCLMALLLVPPATRAQLGDRVQQVVQIGMRAPGPATDAPPAADTAAAAAPDTADAPDVAAEQPAADRTFRYDNPPSISREQYIALWCAADSPACPEAGTMFDALTNPGAGLTPIDPAVEAGQAAHETALGTAGVGVASIKNLHGVQCHAGDDRSGDSPVEWGNGCAGIYASYTDSVKTWVRLLNREYFPEGRMTPAAVVAKYAPAGADGNHPPAYVAVMQSCILQFRAGRDRCDHGLREADAANMAATVASADAPPDAAASGTHTAASARVAAAVQSSTRAGDTTEIALTVTTHAPGLVLGRESLVVADASGQRYRLDTDSSPVTLPQGEAQLTLLVPAPAGARLTLTLTFPPDPPLALDVSAE